jgi:hypothetical protein
VYIKPSLINDEGHPQMNPAASRNDEQKRAAELTSAQAFFYLVRLGGRYERAIQAQPRDYTTGQAIEKHLEFLQEQHTELNCGIPFRRGQNCIRRLRGLEEVAAW